MKNILLTCLSVLFAWALLTSCLCKNNSRVSSDDNFGNPSLAGPSKIYHLENPSEKEKFERMMYVRLFDNGSAQLQMPLISSYILPECTYTVTDGELLIHAVIKDEWDEGFFGVKNNYVIARFTVIDESTLIFESANVPVFASAGARYVYDAAELNFEDIPFE